MRAVFTSVTRLFRCRSFLMAARSHLTTSSSSSPSSSSSSPSPSSPARTRKGRNKSRHELVSDAHIAYMREASMISSSPSSSFSSLSLPLSSPWRESSNGHCDEEEGLEGEMPSSSPAFESLCHELRRVEESMSRYLNEPNHVYR